MNGIYIITNPQIVFIFIMNYQYIKCLTFDHNILSQQFLTTYLDPNQDLKGINE